MHFSSLLPLVSGLAVLALPASVSAIPNAAAFDTWSEQGCEFGTGQREEHQNIPSDVCAPLPGASLKVWFLQSPPAAPAQCQFRAFASSDCTGDYVTYPVRECEDVSQKFSYIVVC